MQQEDLDSRDTGKDNFQVPESRKEDWKEKAVKGKGEDGRCRGTTSDRSQKGINCKSNGHYQIQICHRNLRFPEVDSTHEQKTYFALFFKVIPLTSNAAHSRHQSFLTDNTTSKILGLFKDHLKSLEKL